MIFKFLLSCVLKQDSFPSVENILFAETLQWGSISMLSEIVSKMSKTIWRNISYARLWPEHRNLLSPVSLRKQICSCLVKWLDIVWKNFWDESITWFWEQSAITTCGDNHWTPDDKQNRSQAIHTSHLKAPILCRTDGKVHERWKDHVMAQPIHVYSCCYEVS